MARLSRLRAALLLLVGVHALTACEAPLPTPSEVIDLSPIITEDLPLQIMGPLLVSTRPYPGVTSFEHFSRSAPPYVIRNSLFTLLAHGGPHVDAGSHIFEDGAHDQNRDPHNQDRREGY